ncbi:MAG: glycoside hydrolase family 88 protein [Anaerolineae bacterium]|nr:glycoside hydrolase family 88 protein [Anaerolineae bacterium]
MSHSTPNQPTDITHTPWSLRITTSALSRYSLEVGRWHYAHGLLFKGVYKLYQQTGDVRYWKRLVEYVDHYVNDDGTIKTYSKEEYNLDQIRPGQLLFPVYESTGEDRYKRAIELLRDQLRHHPRTKEGGFWHKQIYPYQMWLDGIYMGSPFYAQYAVTFDEPEAFDDIAFQVVTVEKHTRDPKTGLLYHAWDESRQQRWADPETGCSPHFWSRAIGWYVMAIVDLLDLFPTDHDARKDFVAILERTLTAVSRVQDKATGLWWQVLDQGEREGNYLEASGTSMFIYAAAKGVRKGYLDRSMLDVAVKGFDGLIDNMVTIDDEGLINLHGICSSAGLGGNPYRDGSFEYYIGEPVETNNLHGVGAFILAALELELALAANK